MMVYYELLELSEHFNNQGFTTYEHKTRGRLTIASNSFAAELVQFGGIYVVNNVPFRLASGERGDNMELDHQRIVLPVTTDKMSCIHVLGVSENADLYEVVQFFKNGRLIHEGKLALSDLVSVQPAFHDMPAFTMPYMHTQTGKYTRIQPSMWHCALELSSDGEAPDCMVLSENLFMHIFAVTAEFRRDTDGLLALS